MATRYNDSFIVLAKYSTFARCRRTASNCDEISTTFVQYGRYTRKRRNMLEYFDRSETLRIPSRVTVLATYFSPSLSLRVTRHRDTVWRVYTLPCVLRLFARLHVLTLNLRCCNTVSVYNDSQPRQLETGVGIKITSY